MHILMRAAKGQPTEITIVEMQPEKAAEIIRSELDALLDGKDFDAGIGNLDEDDPDEPVT